MNSRQAVRVPRFAQSHGVSYGQLRGWLSHAPRWRAQLAGQEVPARASGFVQARLSPKSGAVAADALPAHARITCEAGARRAQIDWPVAHAAECAQWLQAWLG